MAVGTVKWFNDSKGFGIIICPDGSEIFVHYTAIRSDGHRTLSEGQEVQFEVYEGKKGPLAKNVEMVI